MDLTAAGINALVVAVVGLIVAWLGKGRFDALDRRFDRVDGRVDHLEARLDDRIDRLEARIDGRMDSLQSSLDAMRSDLTQVALAVGVRPRASNT
jgi:hypothetical protein